MPKRTPDQLRYWSETNKIIGQKLSAYYQACTTEELPPRLVALIKRLDNEETIDEWIEGLLAELKTFSIPAPGPRKPAHPAVPAIIADAITRHAEKIDPKLRREYFEEAVIHFDQLDQHGDPYAETLRRAAAQLSMLIERI